MDECPGPEHPLEVVFLINFFSWPPINDGGKFILSSGLSGFEIIGEKGAEPLGGIGRRGSAISVSSVCRQKDRC